MRSVLPFLALAIAVWKSEAIAGKPAPQFVNIAITSDKADAPTVRFQAAGTRNVASATKPFAVADTIAGTTPASILVDLAKGGVLITSPESSAVLTIVVTTYKGEITATARALRVQYSGNSVAVTTGTSALKGVRPR